MVESSGRVGALVPSLKSRPGPSASQPSAGPQPEPGSEAGAPSAVKEEDAEMDTAPVTEKAIGGEEEKILELDKEFRCPICMQMIRDAFLTACGHSYCYMCIVTHLRSRSDCPCCGRYLAANHIFPNFALDKLLKKMSISQFSKNTSPFEHLCRALRQGCKVSVKELDSLLSLLVEKKKSIERDEAEANMHIMLEFLHRLKKRKLEELEQVQSDLCCITEDIKAVERHRTQYPENGKFSVGPRITADDLEMNMRSGQFDMLPDTNFPSISGALDCFYPGNTKSRSDDDNAPVFSDVKMRGSPLCRATQDPGNSGSVSAKKRRILAQFNELQEYYLQKRRSLAKSSKFGGTELTDMNRSGYHEGLIDFQSVLNTFTRYSRLSVTAELRHGDVFHSSNVVSSIEFDRDDELFATAGVSRRIKVFEYSTVVNEPAEMHFPIVEMATRSKLSCLSWSKYSKNQIASCDYDGIVTVWDVSTRQSLIEFEEHEKRTWSIDFSRSEPSMLVSGSDDCKVKVWCTNQESSVLNINMKANICSVKFNPGSSFYAAVGSADHHIHYYDLRNISQPVHLFSAHRKAVSYVKFLSNDELASASTDSTLRLWDVKENSLIRTYRGHVNEKNFIGLSVNSEYLTCGSETNEVVVYHKAISRPAARYSFSSSEADGGEYDKSLCFTSAVCWKGEGPTLLAANSQGTIKVLALSP